MVEGVAIIYHLGGRSPEPSDKIDAARAQLGGEYDADEPVCGFAGWCHLLLFARSGKANSSRS